MTQALALAAKAKHRTSPNPMVGAVLVRGAQVVGAGYHRRAGGPHAEVAALNVAGDLARGATMYVTLEPCAHHGRTAPCADAIVAAGVAEVFIATRDPDPRVSGRGIARLKAAGIRVRVGDGARQAQALNARWLAARRQGRPFLALKYAASLDGKIATHDGSSTWITGTAARAEVHRLRAAYDAVVVGAGTVLKDDPQLTARLGDDRPASRQPLRVVVDGRLRIRPDARVLDPALPGRALVVTTPAGLRRRGAGFKRRGVDVRVLEPGPDGRIAALALARMLGKEQIASMLIEGGGDLAWGMVAGGIVDQVYAFVAPRILGGTSAPTPVDGAGFRRLAAALQLDFVSARRIGPDILLEAVAA
ncbi:MAG TPA: bifunctional diaminohydroxyphosphoribosylaminopyrimidine deaminase/5-amino-6-(5-phosphoribosylamino)uracil reductase RibD [Candidatus Dormibacteraeota bacterium]|nr:bifunctional diaminohydroxyphosphoribosylaminopyrimidine deaminase/5-amino-6-(5-phosphoribosylamino)uracil reductase RibD [Candidatus Dormibacteraeota bacterium]